MKLWKFGFVIIGCMPKPEHYAFLQLFQTTTMFRGHSDRLPRPANYNRMAFIEWDR